MRVLLDCRMASWTGVGRYTVGLARALAARDDIDLIQVAAHDERPPVAPHQGARSLTAAKHPFSLAGARELGRMIRTVSPDVMHCAHFPTPMPASHPLVVTLHDLSPLLVPGIMPSLPKRLAYRYWNGRAAKIADRICVPSQFTASELTRLFPAALGKIHVTPEAADDFANGSRGLLNEGLAEIADWPYLLSMGSTRPHKDLATLLKAFAIIAPGRPDLRLLLVGSDDYDYVDDALPHVDRSIRDRVFFTGRVGDPALRTLMAGAKVFAFPSRYEGFGLPPLEAMEYGAPVVVADAASLPEVVGSAALLFSPGDPAACAEAILRVLDDVELRDDLVASGHERAAAFSWERTAEQTVAVYAAALSGLPPEPDGAAPEAAESEGEPAEYAARADSANAAAAQDGDFAADRAAERAAEHAEDEADRAADAEDSAPYPHREANDPDIDEPLELL